MDSEEIDVEYVNEEPDTNSPNLSHLSAVQRTAVSQLLSQFKSAVSQNKHDIGFCDIVKHEIDTENHKPIVTKQWPLPHSTKQIMNDQCQEMLNMQVIEPCHSPWRSPSLLVKKNDDSYRYCIDFRNINNITTKDNFPIPRIDIVLESLKGASLFTSLDLKSGYWQIPIAEKDKDKTAFSTEDGMYRFCRMPFGLCNAPATFQRLMQHILKPALNKFAMVYLDDIIIYSPNFEQHIVHLTEVFTLIRKSGLKLSPAKCQFAKTSLKYLGHVVSKSGIQVDPAKISAIEKMQEPRTCRQVRSFVGTASYYRKFIPNFSTICAPLTNLTKKTVKFTWNDEHRESFNNIKSALIDAPILTYPDYTNLFKIHTDASNIGIGALLSQEHDGVDMPIAYFSRKLSTPEINYTVTEKEALGIVAAVKHFSRYVFGYKFLILTDHAPLRYIFQYKATVPRITRWALLLAEFDYEIVFKPGKEHIIPDMLSRAVCSVDVCRNDTFDPASIFAPEKVRKEQEKNEGLRTIIEGLESNDATNPDLDKFALQNNCLYLFQPNDKNENDIVQMRLIVPPTMIKEALYLSHNTTLGGHFGVKKSLHRSRKMFYWPNQCTDIQKHIAHCTECQRRNFQGVTRAQIRQLPVVSYPLQRVGIDLIGKISPSHSGNNYILTIVCHFSRFVQAYPLSNKKTETIARAFMDYVCRYGCPEHIVSDRGTEFNSALFKEVLCKLKSKLHLTTAFHPQSNGLTEAFNKLLKNTLHAMVQADMMSWDEQLPCAVLALNCSFHPAVKNTPYFLFHGRDPPLQYSTLLETNVLNYGLDADTSTSVFTRLQLAFKEAQEANNQAHELNKKYRRVKEITYRVGETVFLKNESKQRAPYSKFQNKWIGPFRIIKVVSDVNYEISPIHGCGKKQVVHSDRLKPARLDEGLPYIGTTEPTDRQPCEKEEENAKTQPNPDLDSDDDDIIIVRHRSRPITTRTPTRKYALRSQGPAPKLDLPARSRKVTSILLIILTVLFFLWFQ